MKKIFVFGASALGLAFTFGTRPLVDYRDVYVGSYFCNRSCLRISIIDHSYLNTADTITISLSKDLTDSVMQIKLGKDTLKAKLLSGGYLVSYPNLANYGGNFFSVDSLSFQVFYGKGLNCNYRGKKK